MSTVIPILIFILILGIVVFIHELGHFIMARRAGVFVEEFALGMGPKLVGFRGKPRKRKAASRDPGEGNLIWHGHDHEPDDALPEDESTLFSLRLFPIGGFCRMRGMDENIPGDTGALSGKKVWQRVLVIGGGSLFNFIAAFVLFFVLTLLTGYSVAQVHSVNRGSPAYNAGLQAGDRITHINDRRVALFEDFSLQLSFSGGEPVDVRFVRDGEAHNVYITPVLVDGNFRLGFVPSWYVGLRHHPQEGFPRVGFWGTLSTSAEMIVFNMRIPFTMLARFVTRQSLPDGAGIMGPIGLAGEVTQVYQEVIQYGILDTVLIMLFFTGLLNAALGVMNLLPIPAMDGARLVFLGIEGIRRKPVPPEREGLVHMVGFVVLILLAVFIAYRDIVRLLPNVVS